MKKHYAEFLGILIFMTVMLIISICSNKTDTNNFKYNQKIIAQVIAAEGCGENSIGMYLIANTIKNRSEQWNKTPYEIVTQPNQYYGLINPNKIQLYNQCQDIADELALKILELPDLTNGAIYFLRPEETKRKWHKKKTLQYKNHIFYK